MVHPDHETRIGAHRVFSVVLVPSSVCPHQPVSVKEPDKLATFTRTLSRTVSVFSSSAALFEKLRKEKSSSRRYLVLENKDNVPSEGEQKNNIGFLERIRSTYSGTSSSSDPDVPPSQEEDSTDDIFKAVVGYELPSVFLYYVGNQSCRHDSETCKLKSYNYPVYYLADLNLEFCPSLLSCF